MKRLGRSTSIDVREVPWTLDELGLAFEHGPGSDADLRTPASLAMNSR